MLLTCVLEVDGNVRPLIAVRINTVTFAKAFIYRWTTLEEKIQKKVLNKIYGSHDLGCQSLCQSV